MVPREISHPEKGKLDTLYFIKYILCQVFFALEIAFVIATIPQGPDPKMQSRVEICGTIDTVFENWGSITLQEKQGKTSNESPGNVTSPFYGF